MGNVIRSLAFRYLAMFALAVTLSSCATKYETLTPEVQSKMMDDLQAGKLVLDCGSKCTITWISQVDSIHTLDTAERWTELAQQVMKIGYGQDLAYYYLGQAAQGLGYQQAAITYYQWSYALAAGQNHSLQCAALTTETHDPCQGVDLASSIPILIQASRDVLAQQAAASGPLRHVVRRLPRPVARTATSSGSATPASASAGGAKSDTWAMPPPAK